MRLKPLIELNLIPICSFLVAETIQYYKTNGSDVYMLSLDAYKAFDRVKYSKLKLLIEINMSTYHKIFNKYIFD